MSKAKIIYNKEKSGKQLKRGGPRDLQVRQKMAREREYYASLSPSVSVEASPKKHEASSSSKSSVQLANMLSLEEVKRRIEEAVASTRKTESDRYKSGLKNLNEQLKNERKKASAAHEQLINANAEVTRLKSRLAEDTGNTEETIKLLHEKDIEIAKFTEKNSMLEYNNTVLNDTVSALNDKMSAMTADFAKKEEELNKLVVAAKVKESVYKELQDKLDKVYEKISDGSIQPLVGTKMDRPSIEDKIFIDPIDKTKADSLDAHININEEDPSHSEGSHRDMSGDLAKLKKILKI